MLAPAQADQPARFRFGWAVGLAAQAVPALLLTLTLAACVLRAGGLPIVQGTMARDETRLALAARAILEHGVPLLHGDFLYTRGLLPAYVEALSFAILGISDQAARLPAIIAGTLLVPAVYVFARDLVGRMAALAPAAMVAFSPPLVVHSREAWFYPWLVLWFVLALTWLQSSLLTPKLETRVHAALAFGAAILSHEFAFLFVPIAAIAELIRHFRSGGSTPRHHLVTFWLIVALFTGLVAALSLLLRASTGGGATAEYREYLRPMLDLRGLSISLHMLGEWHPWLLPAAALGLAAVAGGVPPGGRTTMAVVYFALITLLVFDAFLLTRRGHPRDLLMVIPLLSVAAAFGAYRVAPWVIGVLLGYRLSERQVLTVGGVLLVGLTISSIDPTRLQEDIRSRDISSTFLNALTERTPDDLVISYGPTVTTHYLGRTDFWMRPTAYEKYVWAGPSPFRDVHSGAIVVRGVRELESFVLTPNAGRTLWVVLADERFESRPPPLREMIGTLALRASDERRTADGRVVLRVPL